MNEFVADYLFGRRALGVILPGVTAVARITPGVSFRPLSMVGSAFRWLSHPLSKVSHTRNNTEQQGKRGRQDDAVRFAH